MPLPTKDQVRTDVVKILTLFTGKTPSQIHDDDDLQNDLQLKPDRLNALAMSLRGYIKQHNPDATIVGKDIKERHDGHQGGGSRFQEDYGQMTMRLLSLTVMLLRIGAVSAEAQVPPPASSSESPIIDWLAAHEITIRKTFDGKSKDEGEPAKVSYNSPNAGPDFWLVDLAVKFSEWDVCANCTGRSVIVYPLVEWHRSTSALDATHKVKFGPAVDVLLGDLTKQPVGLITLLKATYERDVLKDVNSGNYTALAGLYGRNKAGGGNTWLPMSHVNDRGGNLVFRYAPFAGIEHYSNLAIEKKGLPTIAGVNVTALAFHTQVDFYPFNTAAAPGWFEVTLSGALRLKVGGDEDLEERLPFGSISCNVYIDKKHHFAIGGDYEKGRSPKNNFDDQRSGSVALKIKF